LSQILAKELRLFERMRRGKRVTTRPAICNVIRVFRLTSGAEHDWTNDLFRDITGHQ
jgi:hypothetical protein